MIYLAALAALSSAGFMIAGLAPLGTYLILLAIFAILTEVWSVLYTALRVPDQSPLE